MNLYNYLPFLFFLTISKSQISSPLCYQNKYEICIQNCICVWCINGSSSSVTKNCVPWFKKDKCNFDYFETIYETDKCQNNLERWKIFLTVTCSIVLITILIIYFFYCVFNKNKISKDEECDLL